MDNSENTVPFTEDEIELLCAFATLFLDGQGGRLKEMARHISENEVEESGGADG